MDYGGISAEAVTVPITYNGDPDVLLAKLSKNHEYQMVARDKLSRGLQKPIRETDPRWAENGASIAVANYNLTGMANQDEIFEGIPRPERYEKDSQAQAYRRLWLEVQHETPPSEDLMVWEYSGMTFDPRLGAIVKSDPGNIFASKGSQQYGAAARESLQHFMQDVLTTPQNVESTPLFNKSQRTAIQKGVEIVKAGGGTAYLISNLMYVAGYATAAKWAAAAASMALAGATIGDIVLRIEQLVMDYQQNKQNRGRAARFGEDVDMT